MHTECTEFAEYNVHATTVWFIQFIGETNFNQSDDLDKCTLIVMIMVMMIIIIIIIHN